MKRFVSRQEESPRMFKNNFMEFFSKVHWSIPILIYLPLIAYLLWISATKLRLSWIAIIGMFLLGYALWTLAEYLLHRFVFHYHPKSKLGKRLFWILHGVHHDYPNDRLRLVMPPAISLPLAVAFYGLFLTAFGKIIAPPLMSGFALGYLIYDISHFAIHHFNLKGFYFSQIREHHLRHHFKDSENGFGVSVRFWDKVFNTEFQGTNDQNRNELST